jgi:pilus assembly protein Flp/PilA
MCKSTGREKYMRSISIMKLMKQLTSDEDGASLIEYTVLLAILLVAVIAIIAAVGQWILNTWTTLNGALP